MRTHVVCVMAKRHKMTLGKKVFHLLSNSISANAFCRNKLDFRRMINYCGCFQFCLYKLATTLERLYFVARYANLEIF